MNPVSIVMFLFLNVFLPRKLILHFTVLYRVLSVNKAFQRTKKEPSDEAILKINIEC